MRRTSKSVPALSTNVVVGAPVEVRIGGVLGSTEEADLEVCLTVIAIDNFPADLHSSNSCDSWSTKTAGGEKHEARNTQARRNDEAQSSKIGGAGWIPRSGCDT